MLSPLQYTWTTLVAMEQKLNSQTVPITGTPVKIVTLETFGLSVTLLAILGLKNKKRRFKKW